METAIGDSEQYMLLSFEELDELKKEISVLVTRIDATRRKLAVENKIRDAANSLNRLNSSASRESMIDGFGRSSSKRQRKSLISRTSGSDLLSKTNDELVASNKKCEDLSQELWGLERRTQELQRRFLEHTAGVLRMTHKGFLEKDIPAPNAESTNGNLDGFTSNHFLGLGHEFDDASFYRSLDGFLEPGDNSGNGNAASAFAQQTEFILEIERKLWDLNRRLRDSIAQASAGGQMLPAPPSPYGESEIQQDREVAIDEQVNYLEKGLDTIQRSQVDTLQGYKQSAYATEDKLEDLNTQLRGIIVQSSQDPDSECPRPPDVTGRRPDEQMIYLGNGLDILERSVQQLKSDHQASSMRSIAHEERVGEYQTVLQDLWQSIDGDQENFSLQNLSASVQSLYTQVTSLQEQKDILNRQIQQQRELNSTSDLEKDAYIEKLTAELEKAKHDIEATVRDNIQESNALSAQLETSTEEKEQLLAELKDKLVKVSSLEAQLQTVREEQEQHSVTAKELESGLEAKAAEAEKARTELQNFEGEMVRLQTELTVAKAELDGAYGTRAQRAAEVASHPAVQKEVEELNERNAAMSDELAGLRTQHEEASSRNAEMQHRVQILQNELSETIGEYEVMTKSSIEFEKEREILENTVDGLRDRIEALETQISDEKVQALAVKCPGCSGSSESMGARSTSTAVLKSEFKKLMRETRAENMRALRVSKFRH